MGVQASDSAMSKWMALQSNKRRISGPLLLQRKQIQKYASGCSSDYVEKQQKGQIKKVTL